MPFCPKCGAETNGGNFCSRCGSPLNNEVSASSSSAYTAQPSAYSPSAASDPAAYKLGWHKFLIYFLLWLYAVIWLLNGATGFLLGNQSSYYIVIGIAFLAIGIFTVYLRFQLAKFRTGAPKKLLIYFAAIGLFCLLAFLMDEVHDPESAIACAIHIAFLVGCWRYYASRGALFIH